MGLPDDSWHLRYYEYSYLFYITFTACFVAFYILIYCVKVPTRRFTNLKEILQNDPIINSYQFRTPEKLPKRPFTFGQTTVPQHNLTSTRMKMKKEESVKLMYTQLMKVISQLIFVYIFSFNFILVFILFVNKQLTCKKVVHNVNK